MSVIVSFRIGRKLQGEEMDKLRHINWSEVMRRAIYETIVREEAKLRRRDPGEDTACRVEV